MRTSLVCILAARAACVNGAFVFPFHVHLPMVMAQRKRLSWNGSVMLVDVETSDHAAQIQRARAAAQGK